jgi:putative ABC transport system permease protein
VAFRAAGPRPRTTSTRNRVFADVAAIRGASANLTLDGVPEQVMGRAVTANFFSVLQVAPVIGRVFTADEDRAGAPVVIIGHGLWLRRYGGDPSIVGRTITMDGAATTVLGVLPRGFVFRDRDVEYFVPASFPPETLARRGSHFLQVVARLKPGVTIEQARGDMAAIAAQLAKEYPGTNGTIGSVVLPIEDDVVGHARVQLIVVMAAAGCVLLIACANLASLLLARATDRRGELGIRAALGASRGRLVRQLLVEALVLSLAGAVVGLAMAPAGMAVVSRLIPVGVADAAVSSVDPRVLAFTLLLGIGTGLVFSLAPALQVASGASAASVHDALQQQTRGAVGARQRATRDALVVVQVAVALMLLAAAGLMIRTLSNLRALELGFRADHMLTLRTTLPQRAYPDAAARSRFYARVLDEVRLLPGVAAAGLWLDPAVPNARQHDRLHRRRPGACPGRPGRRAAPHRHAIVPLSPRRAADRRTPARRP